MARGLRLRPKPIQYLSPDILNETVDHLLINNIGTNSHPAIDSHIANAALHFAVGSIDHTALLNIGTNSHTAIDTHIADGTVHFTEASIDHTALLNIGTNSHTAIDTHIADGTVHFTEASVDHTAITNIGTNSHAAIDTHIADSTIHFTEGSIDHTAITNIGTNTHAQIDTHLALVNQHLDWTASSVGTIDATNYVDNDTTDHTALSNIGTNTHVQIDTHLALTNEHIDWVADQGATNIDRDNLQVFGTSDRGDVPASGGGSTNFLRADGTWANPPGGSASNSFETHTVTDTDSGFSYTETGSAVADNSTDTLTWVSGVGINIDVDASSDAIRVTTVDGEIVHDDLSGFVTAEHIDWALASQGTIHVTNYVDNDTTDHTAFSNIGTNTHVQIDTHLALVNQHLDWTAESVGTIHATNYVDNDTTDHTALSNIGTNTHVQLDTHLALGNAHLDWTAESVGTIHATNYVDNDTTDHTALSNIGTNTHAQLDTHLGLTNSHLDWTASSVGTIHDTNYVDNDTTDHTALSNIGTNTHAQIDTHIALVDEHLDWTADLGGTNLHPNNSANSVLALTSGEVTQLANIGGTTITAADWTAVSVLVGTNTGDQTSIVGITGTMAQFDTAVTDGNIAYSGGPYHDTFSDFEADEHFTLGSIDHTSILNIGTNTHAQIDSHIGDSVIHFAIGTINHTAIMNIGTNTHVQIDTHIANSAIHFTEGSIDHTAILNIGTNTHAQIDTHIADSTVHFIEASISHTNITDIGTNSHATIDSHIADGSIHFAQGGLNDLTDVTLTSPATGGVLYKSAGDWLDTDAIVVDPSLAVSLKYNGTTRFATTNSGADVLGTLLDVDNSGAGSTANLQIRNNAGGGRLSVDATGAFDILQTDSTGDIEDTWIDMTRNGGVKLYYNNSEVFSTSAVNHVTVGDASTEHFIRIRQAVTGLDALGGRDIIMQYETTAGVFLDCITKGSDQGGLVFASDDAVALAAGEARNTLITNQSMVAENVYLAADGSITFYGGLQSGWANRAEWVFSNGTFSYDGNGTAADDLIIKNNISGGDVLLRNSDSENMLIANSNAGVALYHNNVQQFTTISNGVTVDGINVILQSGLDNNTRFRMTNTQGGSRWQVASGSGNVQIGQDNSSGSFEEVWIDMTRDGQVSLNYNGTREFRTKSGGCIIDDELEINGALNHDGSTAGFFGTAPASRPTGVGVDATSIHAALVTLGLITA